VVGSAANRPVFCYPPVIRSAPMRVRTLGGHLYAGMTACAVASALNRRGRSASSQGQRHSSVTSAWRAAPKFLRSEIPGSRRRVGQLYRSRRTKRDREQPPAWLFPTGSRGLGCCWFHRASAFGERSDPCSLPFLVPIHFLLTNRALRFPAILLAKKVSHTLLCSGLLQSSGGLDIGSALFFAHGSRLTPVAAFPMRQRTVRYSSRSARDSRCPDFVTGQSRGEAVGGFPLGSPTSKHH
jgi:hypothetical protein